MNAKMFLNELENLSFENTFNPYFDCCEVHDFVTSPSRRRGILTQMLNAAAKVNVDSIWIGRDLGYRGGRRTGLALTDDVRLPDHLSRWSVTSDKITKGQAVPERTASVIWSVLEDIRSPVFLWNVFPMHPFKPESPFSNRAHNSLERKAGEEILDLLIKLVEPKRLIAIGNDAERAALKFSAKCQVTKVRHPSYGGQNIFLKQIRQLYNCRT